MPAGPASIKKRDHDAKAGGYARYLDDLNCPDTLCGRVFRSEKAHALLRSLELPPLPDGYVSATAGDIPGRNRIPFGKGEMPILAEEEVRYIGEPILLLAGPDPKVVGRLLHEVRVEYEELDGCFDPMASTVEFCTSGYSRGDCAAAFAEADRVFEESLSTGLQEHAYIEPQSMMGQWREDQITVWGSLQCPFYVQAALKNLSGLPEENLRVIQTVTGGAFGGKEDYPSLQGCQAALLSRQAGGRPVKIVLDRQEDMAFTTKRHPSVIHYRTAVKANRITALQADVVMNGGAYSTLTSIVIQRAVLAAPGPYRISNLSVQGRGVQTNTPPNGAFRGFGGPQPGFAIEAHLNHIAVALGVDPVAFKLTHLVRQGDPTSSNGIYHFPVPVRRMMELLQSGLQEPEKGNARYRTGRGYSIAAFGCGLAGDTEKKVVQARVRLRKDESGSVEVLTSATDMGQGVLTLFTRLAANKLQLPLEKIVVREPDTSRVPDSGPTTGSRSAMTVGLLVEQAAEQLRRQWVDGRADEVEVCYEKPAHMLPFDAVKNKGDAYPDFSWSVNAVTVSVDTLTGLIRVTDARGIYDVGVPLDLAIVKGQMEGGLTQSLGYAFTEQMTAPDGKIRNCTFSDYLIPTALDLPQLHVDFFKNPSTFGGGGAKSAGELPALGGAPAFLAAVEDALNLSFQSIPLTPEQIINAMR